MNAPSTLLKDFLDKSPFRELVYRALLWVMLGSGIAHYGLFSYQGIQFEEALDRYVDGISSWDKIATLSILAASIVFAFRSIEFSILSKHSAWLRGIKHFVGICAKVSGDIALASFGAGVAILVTLIRLPTRLEGDLNGYVAFSMSMGFLLFAIVVVACCYLVSRLGTQSRLYRWQSEHWWAGPLFSPALVIGLLIFYVQAL